MKMSNNGGVEHRSRRIATHHDSIMYGGRGILVEVSSRALFIFKSGNNNRQIYALQLIATDDIAIYAGRKNRIVHDDVRPSRSPSTHF